MRASWAVVIVSGLLALAACAESPAPPRVPPPPALVPPVAPVDPLGARPAAPWPAPFTPPTPTTFVGPNGLTVWLLERHTVPFVAATLTVPSGSSSDPRGKGGLADATADMLDEGAGALGALELSRAVDTLGATVNTGVTPDASTVSMSVLKKNLGPAFEIFGDVVARPRFDAAEWKRVRDLWINDLRGRASEPDEVARVVERVVLYGDQSPYGHPVDGTLASARHVSLKDVRTFYRTIFRPDRAVLVVAGDVTRDELSPLLTKAFGGWKSPATPPPAPLAPPMPAGPWLRGVVMVDWPDAPQSVLAVVRPGVAATDASFPALSRVNDAIGGSFTSRLNQDLREEHGWTYGARAGVSMSRGVGLIVMGASVVTESTGPALKALLADIEQFAKNGLTEEEVDKTRSQARSDLVATYETLSPITAHLATDAALGLPVDYEAKASLLRDAANKQTLDKLAADYFDPSHAFIVIVGPRSKLTAPLAELGFSQIEVRDAEGNVLSAGGRASTGTGTRAGK